MELIYEMRESDYKDLLKMDGIKSKDDVIAYINKTYGLLGTVVEIAFER